MKDLTKKEVAAICRRAAEALVDGRAEYYGYALDVAGQPEPGGSDSPLQDEFNGVFSGVYEDWHADTPRNHTYAAILSLLLMADIVESEGWPLP